MSSASENEGQVAQDQTAPVRRSFSSRGLLLAAAGLVAAGMLALATYIGSWLLEPNTYATVPSIEADASFRDPNLMVAAWQLPVAERYRAHPFEYQENQSFCGPASIADLLHSIGLQMSQDAVIAGTRYKPWFGILLGGLTLDQLADVLRQKAAQPVTVLRDLSLAQFREELAHVNDPKHRYILNFHRGPLFGRGHGHFSPLLGYLPGPDLVLVGDVNSAYRPYLVGGERLWRAMDTVDGATGRKRGLLRVDLN